ncbi:immunity 53 family protein [Streptomyces sp. NPDC049879]|uniref:immunity 53 family protein n=1 Tax=Streptomyces sp. NPDC049879 TaxID=3365598 RepID=UPI00378C31D1
MSEAGHVLDWLQHWYASHCDGDWEHEGGVAIGTLDNPGWTAGISLEGTDLADRACPRQQVTRDEHDWVAVWTAEKTFHIACGPGNLTEALALFRTWASEGAPPGA